MIGMQEFRRRMLWSIWKYCLCIHWGRSGQDKKCLNQDRQQPSSL